MRSGTVEVVCPRCRGELERTSRGVRCAKNHEFPALASSVDFLAGSAAADASLEISMDYAAEESSAPWRVEKYLMPQLERLLGGTARGRLVLDDGCGIGSVVAELSKAGVDAYGIDPGSRVRQWSGSPVADRLFRADGTMLPFRDSVFDAVISSGVLEHLGEPDPWPQRLETQVGYMREALRVLKPGGVALMAAPNGAHPIDYWHGRKLRSAETATSPMRLHPPFERWMPNSRRLRQWISATGYPAHVEFLTPENYLAFERIQRHWAGRMFTSSMKGVFRLITRYPTLAASPLNPWLVVAIRKQTPDELTIPVG